MFLGSKRGWRIGIAGSASVGKTTLAHALSQKLGLVCIEEEMRAHLLATGVRLETLPAQEAESILQQLWAQRQSSEAEAGAFVADNCAADFAAYALSYGCLSDAGHAGLIAAAAEHLHRYDAVFLLPWGVLPYEEDGVRHPDRYLQLRQHMLLEGVLRKHVAPEKLHVLPETLKRFEDRQAWALACLQAENTDDVRDGVVYLVGAGPGDPKLLTVRARELLRRADVVAYDLLLSPEILAMAPQHAEMLAVGRRNGTGPTSYQLHPDVLTRAREGKVVVRLKAGDPLLFGRGGEEAEELRSAGIAFEIVPGITAALGAAAYAGIPLTHRGRATEVVLRTGHDAGASEGTNQRTTVLYMAARRLRENVSRLLHDGYSLDTPAALIASASTPRQQVVMGTLETLEALAPNFPAEVPVILFAGRVVALRDRVQWFAAGPLQGRRVLVARARPGESRIAATLRELGAEVLETPRVHTEANDIASQLRELTQVGSVVDGVVFACAASVNTVAVQIGSREAWLSMPAVVCIGKQAGEAWQALNLHAVPVLHGNCMEAIEARRELFAGKRLLLIAGDDGRPQLCHDLQSLGATVDVLCAYRTERTAAEVTGNFDVAVLPSSSATQNILAEAANELLQTPMVAIGPHTRDAALRMGAQDVTLALHDDTDAVVTVVLQRLAEQTQTAAQAVDAKQAVTSHG